MNSFICSLTLALALSLPSAIALADNPVVHIDVIDSEGQVAPTDWRTASTFIWSQNHLLLQTAIEIPSHFASLLPLELQSSLRGDAYQTSFHLADDHLFLVLELHDPTVMFKLANSQSLKVAADFNETTWMRNSVCRDVNAFLSKNTEDSEGAQKALFLSLFCKSTHGGTWVEVASSNEVSLNFEPHDQTRFRSVAGGTEFWIPSGASRRTLADIIVTAGNGQTTSRYSLELQSPPESHMTAAPEEPALPILVVDAAPVATNHESLAEEASHPSLPNPVLGIEAQVLEAHGASDHALAGKTQTEISILGRYSQPLSDDGGIDVDLNLPIRRLGAGLDSRGAGSHIGWLNAGYELPLALSRLTSLTFGAQASVLDVYAPARSTEFVLSPSVEAHFGSLYSVVLAPFDLVSNLSIVRARADLPMTRDMKNRLTFEALLGRTLIEPQSTSWNVNGITVGFVGEF